MKKTLVGVMLLTAVTAMAQETYENANLVKEDLSGTARYVGMGGAMEALGADMSVMSSNPAGIGMFRKSQVAITGGVVIQPGATSTENVGGSRASFDQIGFVWSQRMGKTSNMNFGFNYNKSRNFHSILDVTGTLNNASQNKLTAAKGYEGVFEVDNAYTQADYLNENVLGLYDKEYGWAYFNADKFSFVKAATGYVNNYSFNISGNPTRNLYLGLTIGVKNLRYDAWSTYTESLLGPGDTGIGTVSTSDHRMISGSGANVTIGAIFMPIDGNPFRIGASIQTPTWYSLNTQNTTEMVNKLLPEYGAYDNGKNNESYDFRLNTPWKFGVSLGHTIANKLALGVSYEYAGCNHTSTRILNGRSTYGGTSTYADANMNSHTRKTLKGVSTLKVGAELKVTPMLALRAGYNFVSGMYNMDGFRDGTIDSPGTYYSSTTEYTNWKATHRATAGVGLSLGKFGIDVAYQFNTTSGEFAPFMSYNGDEEKCIADVVNVSNKRHQVIGTLSFRF